MASALSRTKSVDRLLAEAQAVGEGTLKRTLGGWSLVALGIGGITLETASSVLDAGATAVAVIGDLLGSGDPAARTRAYLQTIERDRL